MKEQLRMSFFTLEGLINKQLWLGLFENVENLLGSRLSHLDTNDPVRKKVSSLSDAADFVCRIGEKEGSRRLFGKFDKSKTELGISLFRDVKQFPNSVSFYFPGKIIDSESGRSLIWNAFAEGNKRFRPFYSFCDFDSIVAQKRKATGFSVDLQAELIGVFWMTYFNKIYVEFIGRDKFEALSCEKDIGQNGAVIKLGSLPSSLGLARESAENVLGRKLFVDPHLNFDKPLGKNAMTFSRMLEESGKY